MITVKREDIGEYTDYVKSIYPDMIEDFWFAHGELLFFVSKAHAENDPQHPFACYKKNGKFVIVEDF